MADKQYRARPPSETDQAILDAVPEMHVTVPQEIVLAHLIPGLKAKHKAAQPLLACDYCDRTGTGDEMNPSYSKARVRQHWWIITICGECLARHKAEAQQPPAPVVFDSDDDEVLGERV